MKFIGKFFLIFIIGGLGGLLMDRLFLPYLVQSSPFNRWDWLRDIKNGTTIINKVEKITITENKAIEDAIDRVKHSVVGVAVKRGSGRTEQLLNEGNGFFLTSDGLVVTLGDLIPAVKSSDIRYDIIKDNRLISAQLIKKDSASNLALLKIQESNLPVVSLADEKSLQLGQIVVLIALEIEKETTFKFINLGNIRSLKDGEFSVNFSREKTGINGSPLFNAQGEVIGLNFIDLSGNFRVISIEKIKKLMK